MARVVTVRKEDGTVVCERCLVADSAWLRMKGLLGRAELPAGEGVLIRPTSSIHMLFMRFPIDAVFVDRELRVVKVVPELRPWRFAAARRAHAVFELAAGACARTGVHAADRLVLD
jgi:uncharacterized membrane protein (UPF0127 family)